MSTAVMSFIRFRVSLARALMFILANVFAGLMLDIRVEHVDVVHERSIAWAPIIYCGLMSIACLAENAAGHDNTRFWKALK